MNNVISRTQWSSLQPGARDGNWMWNGSQWVCSPDCGTDGGCPPFGPPVFSGPTSQPPWYPGANGGVSFGAVAPANPVRGHMWWDGKTFWLFDGAAWVGIGGADAGSGVSPGPGPVDTTTQVFNITQPGPVSVTASTWDIIPFTGTPAIDTETGWDVATKKYTPKTAGVYQFNLIGIGGGGATAGVTGIALLKNDSGTFTNLATDPVVTVAVADALASAGLWIAATCMIHLNGTTDYVRAFFYNATQGQFNGGGNTPVLQAWLMP